MRKSKTDHQDNDDDEASDTDVYARERNNGTNRRPAFSKKLIKAGKNEGPRGAAVTKGKRFRSEIKRPEEILKQRKIKEKNMAKNVPKGMRKKRQRDGGGKGGKTKGFSKRK